LSSDGVGGIAVSEGLVIVGGRDVLDTGDLWVALDARNGQERWRLLYAAPGKLDFGSSPRATPLAAGGTVFLLGAMGHLHAVDSATGTVKWQKNLALEFSTPRLEWGLTGSPLVADGNLIVQPGGRSACLLALARSTGEMAWKTAGGKPGHASFIVARLGGKLQLVGYDADSLGGWDTALGTRLWKIVPALSGDFNVPTPIRLDEKRLFVCTENNGARIYEFGDDGLPKSDAVAAYDPLKPDSHTPVASGGRIYGVAGGLRCLDATDGLREIWVHEDAAFSGYASLIVCGRRLLAYTPASELVLLEDVGDSGRVLSRLTLDPSAEGVLSHPALVGTRLFVRVGKRIDCLELAAHPGAQPTGP
jgi:outer membrane protein assembly factor BamB